MFPLIIFSFFSHDNIKGFLCDSQRPSLFATHAAVLLTPSTAHPALSLDAASRPQIDRHDMIQDVLLPWCMFNMFMSFHQNMNEFMTSRLQYTDIILSTNTKTLKSASTISSRDLDVQYLKLMTLIS